MTLATSLGQTKTAFARALAPARTKLILAPACTKLILAPACAKIDTRLYFATSNYTVIHKMHILAAFSFFTYENFLALVFLIAVLAFKAVLNDVSIFCDEMTLRICGNAGAKASKKHLLSAQRHVDIIIYGSSCSVIDLTGVKSINVTLECVRAKKIVVDAHLSVKIIKSQIEEIHVCRSAAIDTKHSAV